MGFAMFASLIVENSRCREEWVDIAIPLLMWGAIAGGFGSLVWLTLGLGLSPKLSFVAARSILGATIQRTRYSSETKRILQDHTDQPAGSDVKVISGIDILTNNQVRPPFMSLAQM